MAQGRDTLKEIAEQFDTWQGLLDDMDLLEKDVQTNFAVREYDDVLFTGAGSSFHLATAAAAAFRRITGEMAHACAASDLLFFHEYMLKSERKYLAVAFSRSGRTTETLEALAMLRQRYRVAVVGVTCDPVSPLAASSDLPLPVKNCIEQSLIMTKSFTSMLLLSLMFAAAYGDKFTYMNYLDHLPEEGRMAFEMNRRVVDEFLKERDPERATYLGGGPFLGLAREGALKLDEMALTRSQAMAPLEMRHGPRAGVRPGDIMVLLLSNAMRGHELQLLFDLKEQGASVFILADRRDRDFEGLADAAVLTGRGLSDDFRGILYMPFLQYLGCRAALNRGLDPDAPANLTRVVTL